MKRCRRSVTLLMAEDDPDDRLLVREAFSESRLVNEIHFVEDGEALMDYLYRRGKYKDVNLSPRPDLILLDLNMPKKDGREALIEIKTNPDFRKIPVVVFTTSTEKEDIIRSYESGASSFIVKPVTFDKLLEMVESFNKYWFETVALPPGRKDIVHG